MKKKILYSCAEVDLFGRVGDKYFSPLLASIHLQFAKKYEALNVVTGHCSLNSDQVKDGVLLLHRYYLITLKLNLYINRIFRRGKKKFNPFLLYLYKWVLRINNIKLVFAIDPRHELCEACHRSGIPIIEPIHGFGFSTDELFRSLIADNEDIHLPDLYLAFDIQTYNSLQIFLAHKAAKVLHMPHPWHIECANPYSPLIDTTRFKLPEQDYKKRILYSLQWGYDGEASMFSGIIPNGILHDTVVAAIENTPEVHWLLRLHPVQQNDEGYGKHREFVKELSNRFPNVEYEIATSAPLPYLLSVIDGHITMCSGVATECSLYGVPNLMLCPTLKPNGPLQGAFREGENLEYFTFGDLDTGAIVEWIQKLEPGQEARYVYAGQKEYYEKQIQQVWQYLSSKKQAKFFAESSRRQKYLSHNKSGIEAIS